MKGSIFRVLGSFILLSASASHAWIPGGEIASIDEIIQWQDNLPIVFKLSNGYHCWIPNEEKAAYSLILSLYASGKKASIYCHDAEENKGGYLAHRLHRITAIK